MPKLLLLPALVTTESWTGRLELGCWSSSIPLRTVFSVSNSPPTGTVSAVPSILVELPWDAT